MHRTVMRFEACPSRLPAKVCEFRRFCIVTETYPPEVNGVALTLARLIEGLRAQGHEVSVVRPRQRKVDDSVSDGDPQLTLVHSLPLPGYRGLHIGLVADRELRRCWAQQRPDVVYVATQGPLGWSAVRAARRLRIPIFSGFHTNFDNYAQHYHAGWLRAWIVRYLQRFHERTEGTIVPNAELLQSLRELGFRNLSLLGRGVDTLLFSPERRNPKLRHTWGAGKNDLVALYVGRIAAEKNLDLAVDAYRAMQRINPNVRFVLVGEGPMRSALQKRHADLIFCGVRRGDSLAEHYASADIFLFPSETETFGNVTLEAMASGLAVVAFDYAAARAHIKNGRTGMLADCGDAQTFIKGAATLALPRASLGVMRRQARADALSLDWRQIVDKFAAILLGATDHRPPLSDGRAWHRLRRECRFFD